nr:fumarylacetoacetate hydrolase family protein [Erythrobacter rubeus]
MKVVTFQNNNEDSRMGFLVEGRLLDPSQESSDSVFLSTQAFIEAGAECWAEGRAIIARASARTVDLSPDIRLLAPIPVPVQMRDFMCFEGHVRQSMEGIVRLQAMSAGEDPEAALEIAQREGRCDPPQAWYDQPLYYKANRHAVSGPGDTIEWPAYSSIMDYECELACIIGNGGKDIDAAEARSHIFGFTIWNDFSARDAQFDELPGFLGPAKGKTSTGRTQWGPVSSRSTRSAIFTTSRCKSRSMGKWFQRATRA